MSEKKCEMCGTIGEHLCAPILKKENDILKLKLEAIKDYVEYMQLLLEESM